MYYRFLCTISKFFYLLYFYYYFLILYNIYSVVLNNKGSIFFEPHVVNKHDFTNQILCLLNHTYPG